MVIAAGDKIPSGIPLRVVAISKSVDGMFPFLLGVDDK